MRTMMMALALLAAAPLLAADTPVLPASRQAATGKTAPKKAAVTPHAISAGEAGRYAVCPVTGEKFKVSTETVAVDYKGKTYFFCCPGCDKTFLKTPEKYAVKAAAPAVKATEPPGEAVKVTHYVCPMGDYEGDKPGKCPKCGMELEPKK